MMQSALVDAFILTNLGFPPHIYNITIN